MWWVAAAQLVGSAVSSYNKGVEDNNAIVQNTMTALANAQANAGNPNATQPSQPAAAQAQLSEAEQLEQARMA